MNKSSHPQISFNNVPVSRASFQKHLGIYLDEKLNFNYHIKEKMTKAMKGMVVIKINQDASSTFSSQSI